MLAVRVLLWLVLLGAARAQPTAAPTTHDISADDAYAAHDWFALREIIRGREASVLHRGAVACAFENAEAARKIFTPLLEAAEKSNEAFEARRWLSYAYLRSGQYRRGLAEIEAMAALQPDNAGLKSGRLLFQTLSLAPEQTVTRRASVRMNYKKQMGAFFPAIRVNGRAATYFMDCGANISMISEGEAKRTGMTFHAVGGAATQVIDATGAQTGFRVAVADEIALEDFIIRNVAFLVFPDDRAPWKDLPEGERGGLGISVWLALGTLRVEREGRFEAGFPAPAIRGEPNLGFDGATPIARAGFGGRQIPLLLDSGASTTDFWPPFARAFAAAMKAGQPGSRTISGVGSRETFATIELPEVALELGGLRVVRRPAHVLLEETAPESKHYHARLGWDLVAQAACTTFDFEAMTLRLE